MIANIATRNEGFVPVEAQRTKTAGLIVHRTLPLTRDPATNTWDVTHAASGLSVACFDKLRSARRFAVEIGPLADWTKPSEELTKKGAVDVGRLRRIRDEIRAEES